MGAAVLVTVNCGLPVDGVAQNATLNETVPAGTTFDPAHSSSGWSCLPNNNAASTCTLSLGTVAPGASGRAAFAVTVLNPLPPGITNIANTACAQTSSNPSPTNNCSTATTPPAPPNTCTATPNCLVAASPAATLLIPYFAVDVTAASGGGMDTVFSVTNAGAAPQLISVTLWSDWAIPVMTFNSYLTGYGVQSYDLRILLATGAPPQSGSSFSSQGGLSEPNQLFPGCDANNVSGPRAKPQLVRRSLLGLSVFGGQCAASHRSNLTATGYITVDVVNSCSTLNPSNLGFFAQGGTGIASDANVLLGEYYYVDLTTDFAASDTAVHIRADAQSFGQGAHTFYARYVAGDGSDNRQPLGTVFGAPYQTDSWFSGTDLIIWRDTKSPDAAPVRCGTVPSWAPLNTSAITVWDDQENDFSLPESSTRLPWATQTVSIGSTSFPVAPKTGWLALDLSHGSASTLFGDVAQGWVSVINTRPGRWTVGHRAWTLQSVCDAGH